MIEQIQRPNEVEIVPTTIPGWERCFFRAQAFPSRSDFAALSDVARSISTPTCRSGSATVCKGIHVFFIGSSISALGRLGKDHFHPHEMRCSRKLF
jgi:hypothetical protein